MNACFVTKHRPSVTSRRVWHTARVALVKARSPGRVWTLSYLHNAINIQWGCHSLIWFLVCIILKTVGTPVALELAMLSPVGFYIIMLYRLILLITSRLEWLFLVKMVFCSVGHSPLCDGFNRGARITWSLNSRNIGLEYKVAHLTGLNDETSSAWLQLLDQAAAAGLGPWWTYIHEHNKQI